MQCAKKRVTIILFIYIFIFIGCSSMHTPYLVNRKNDAADIFTFCVNASVGAKVRVGLFQTGLFLGNDFIGLKGGEFFQERFLSGNIDLEGFIFSMEEFEPKSHDCRRKHYVSLGGPLYNYVLCASDMKCDHDNSLYTQIEVAGGIIGGLRLGFNIGELLDFLLGWGSIDIYGDDIICEHENE